jgi:outer membrane protein
VQKGLVTRSQAEEMQQALQQKQQGIYQLQDQLRGEIADEQQVMNNKTLNSIMEYLKEYNKDKGYSYVVSRSFGGPVLFADPGLNITADVLRGLNEKYASTKKDSAK